mmetsp:Transcript_3217/g.13042  ORF Transcript_3217/g.13042 Transcript_3217/m.13042 type:complete len:202 (-) Transcript_3217:266-871(-)
MYCRRRSRRCTCGHENRGRGLGHVRHQGLLGGLLARAHCQHQLLGDSLAQHPRLHALRALAALAARGAGSGPAVFDGRALVRRSGSHRRLARPVWRRRGGSCAAHRARLRNIRGRRARARTGRPLGCHPVHQHRRKRGRARVRAGQCRAAGADVRVQRRAHRAGRRAHATVAARSVDGGFHIHLADRLFGAARARRRHHDR